MESRSKESYQYTLHDFIKFDIWVVCPSCQAKAVVKVGQASPTYDVRVTCLDCGYASISQGRLAQQAYTLGAPIDPFLKIPLWLQANVEGHTLWAYNPEHLKALKEHIAAKLRERNTQPNTNQSIGSRLPKWMTNQKNREAILKKIAELERM